MKFNLKLYIEINFSNQNFTLHMDLTYLFLTFFKNILKYKSLENKNPKNNKYDVP